MAALTLRCSITCYLYLFQFLLLNWYPVQAINCNKPVLRNGIAKLILEGRVVRFKCTNTYRLFGPKVSNCVNGKWDSVPPVCARQGCASFNTPQFGRKIFSHRNAVVSIDCAPDYILNGSRSLYCDGKKWVGNLPTCLPKDREPSLFCDFDNDDLCGWNQDLTDNADWLQHAYNVPSRPVGTGPKFDHTFGDGFGGRYMYAESSSPRLVNDSARLLSPLYPASISNGTCFSFWYHMFGATMGQLRVYQKAQGDILTNLSPSFDLQSDQGDEWRKGFFLLKTSSESFQLVFEAVRGPGYLSDIAIDDVSIASDENCTISTQPYDSTAIIADSGSCQYRCGYIQRQVSGETPAEPKCDCDASCDSSRSCCHDYEQYCVTPQQGVTESMLPALITTGRTTPLSGVINTVNSSTSITSTTTTAGITNKNMSTTKTSMNVATSTLNTTIVTERPTTSSTQTTNSTVKNNIITTSIQNTTIKHIYTTFSITSPAIINTTTPRKYTRATTTPYTTIITKSTSKPTRATRLPFFTTKMNTKVTQEGIVPITKAPIRTTVASITRIKSTTSVIKSSQKTQGVTAPAFSEDAASEVDTSPGLLVLTSAVLGATVLLLGGGAALFLVTRRRMIRPWNRRSQGIYSDDSDVRFLTASDGEVQLDFTLASTSN